MLPDVFRAERDKFPLGATVVYVTAAFTPLVSVQLETISQLGFKVVVLYAGDGEVAEKIGEFPVVSISQYLDDLPGSENELGYDPELTEAFGS